MAPHDLRRPFKRAAISDQQRRRELSLQRKAQHRRDAQHQARCLASFLNPHSDPQQPEPEPSDSPKELNGRHASKLKGAEARKWFAQQLMLPEWMIDVPDQLPQDRYVFARPAGKRCFVVSSNGTTVSRLRNGSILHHFPSALPPLRRLSMTVLHTASRPSMNHWYTMAFIVIILILVGITTSASTTTTTNSTKLKLLHRERNGNYSHWFQQRMKRDAKRVAYLMNRMEQLDFVGEVMFGVNEGVGEYIIPIKIGSPPITQHVIMDTGNDLIWVQCQKCQQCHSQFDPIFDPARSSSYTEIPCESLACDGLNGNKDCDHKGSCSYRASFADGSESKGTLVFETIVFGDIRILNMAIGCGYTNKGTFGHQAGILGLRAGPLSLVYEIPVGGFFSYCLPSRDSQVSGSLVIGREDISSGSVWVPLLSSIKNPSFYYVRMIGLGVGGIRLPISEDIFHLTESGDGGVIMDSGTTVSRFPKVAYEALRDAFIAQTMDIPRAPGVDLFDTRFSLPNTVTMPSVSFHFWSDIGEVSLVIPPRNFLVAIDNMRTTCFAFAPSLASFSIIGNIQQEQIKISYDTVGRTLGFHI